MPSGQQGAGLSWVQARHSGQVQRQPFGGCSRVLLAGPQSMATDSPIGCGHLTGPGAVGSIGGIDRMVGRRIHRDSH